MRTCGTGPVWLPAGGKGNAMKKGIRCNEIMHRSGEGRDRIRFVFLTDDGNTPSSATVQLGDIDTVTGEAVTDVTIFREYYRLKDQQARKNLKVERPAYTKEEAARRKQARKEFAEEFRRRWGYEPSRDDLMYLMEEQKRWNLSLSALVNEDGEDRVYRHRGFSVFAVMEEEESIEMQALREVGESLTGRLAVVYEAMIQQKAGGKVRLKKKDIADQWDVKPPRITKDQKTIMAMVRKRAEEIRQEEE